MSHKKIIYYGFTYCIPIIMVVYYLIMRGINLNSYIVLPIFALLTLEAVKIAIKHSGDKFVKMMNLFMIYCLGSGVLYAFNDAPFSCYIATFRTFVFPVIFAYLGYYYSRDFEFNKWYVWGCVFCFVVGMYLYFTTPSYYLSYLVETQETGFKGLESGVNESNILEFTRFSSFFSTSYAVSCFSIPALIISQSFSLREDAPIKKFWCYLISFVSFVAAMICQQRIAMAFAILILLFFALYSAKLTNAQKGWETIFVYIFIGIIVAVLIGAISQMSWFQFGVDVVSHRFEAMSFDEAMGLRTSQYTSFDRATDWSFITGLGLGSCGHAAVFAGLKGIADGEFVKTFYEMGVLGCFFWALLIITTLIKGLRQFKLYYMEVLIVVFYLAAGIGSNSLSFFIYSIMFWYSVGRIWNKSYHTYLIAQRKIN